MTKGLDYLVSAQKKSGSFAPNKYGRMYRRGVTGICVLALLASGKERYLQSARKGLGYLVKQDRIANMYSHGYATLALCEGAILWPKDYEAAADHAVKAILKSQNRHGGWGYQASRRSLRTESCMVGLMLHALYSARKAGLVVPDAAVEKAKGFLHRQFDARRRMFNNDTLELGFASPSYGATGMAVAALEQWGERASETVGKALKYLGARSVQECTANLRGMQFSGYSRGRFHFELLAHGIALYHARDRQLLKGWLPKVRQRLRGQVHDKGYFEGWFGKAYGTGLTCLLLQLDRRPRLAWFAK